jgi:hypothetical protein
MSEDGLDNLRLGQVTRDLEFFKTLPVTETRRKIIIVLERERDEILRRDNTVPTTPPTVPVEDMKATFKPVKPKGLRQPFKKRLIKKGRINYGLENNPTKNYKHNTKRI